MLRDSYIYGFSSALLYLPVPPCEQYTPDHSSTVLQDPRYRRCQGCGSRLSHAYPTHYGMSRERAHYGTRKCLWKTTHKNVSLESCKRTSKKLLKEKPTNSVKYIYQVTILPSEQMYSAYGYMHRYN